MEILGLEGHERFVEIVFEEAEKSKCFKQKVGAVIVRGGEVLARGYNKPVGDFCEKCVRRELDLHGGENVEVCFVVHAEQNALIDALNRGIDISGAVMYVGAIKNGERRIHKRPYCTVCSKILASTKLKGIIHYGGDKLVFYDPQEENELALKKTIGDARQNHNS